MILGKNTNYQSNYNPNILHKIPRSNSRENLQNKNFKGIDIWNIYELSWLDIFGIPNIALLRIIVNASSKYIIESKSLKLYIGSFANEKFKNIEDLYLIIYKDLSNILGDIYLQITTPDDIDHINNNYTNYTIHNPLYINLENALRDDSFNSNYQFQKYNVDKSLLKHNHNQYIKERVCSNLMRSNCLITNQPDYASIYIDYQGVEINKLSLLKYIVSYRNHNEFHEQAVERFFSDFFEMLNIKTLSLYAKYTRRGGIDINPYRTNDENLFELFIFEKIDKYVPELINQKINKIASVIDIKRDLRQ